MAVEPRKMSYGDQTQPQKESAAPLPQKPAASGASCAPHDGASASVQSALDAESNGRQSGPSNGPKNSSNANKKAERNGGTGRHYPRSALYTMSASADGSFDSSSALSAALDVRRKRRRLLRSLGTRSVRKLAQVLDETFRLALTARSSTEEHIAKLFASLASSHLKPDSTGSSGAAFLSEFGGGTDEATTIPNGDTEDTTMDSKDTGAAKDGTLQGNNAETKERNPESKEDAKDNSMLKELSRFWQNAYPEVDNESAEADTSLICLEILQEFAEGPIDNRLRLVNKVKESVQPKLRHSETGKEDTGGDDVFRWVQSIYEKLKHCGVLYNSPLEEGGSGSVDPARSHTSDAQDSGKKGSMDMNCSNSDSNCKPSNGQFHPQAPMRVDINRLLALLPALKLHSADIQELVKRAPSLGYRHSPAVRQFYLEHLVNNVKEKSGSSRLLMMTVAATAAVASLQSHCKPVEGERIAETCARENEANFVEQWKRKMFREVRQIDNIAATIHRLLCPNQAVVSPLNSHVYAPEVSQNSTNLPSLTVLAAIISEARRRYDDAIDQAVEKCAQDQTIDKLLDAGWDTSSLSDTISKYYSGGSAVQPPTGEGMPREKTKANRREIAKAFVTSIIPTFDPLQVVRDATGDSDSPLATGDALCGAYVCGSGAAAALKSSPELRTHTTSLKELVDCFQPVRSSSKRHRDFQQGGAWSPCDGSASPMTPIRQDSMSSLNSYGTPRDEEYENGKYGLPRFQSFGGTSSASSAEEGDYDSCSLLERESTWLAITGRSPLRLIPVPSDTPWEQMTHDQRLHYLLSTGAVKIGQERKGSTETEDTGQQSSSVMVALKPYAPQNNDVGKANESSFRSFGFSSEAAKGTPLSPQSSSGSVSSRLSDSAASAWDAYAQSSVHTPQFVDLGTAVIDGTVDKGTKIWDKYGAVPGYGYGSGSNWRRPETAWDRFFDEEGRKVPVSENKESKKANEDTPIDRTAPDYIDLGGYKCSEAVDGDTTDSSVEDISDLHYEKVHEEIHRKIRERMSSVSTQHKKSSASRGRGHARPPPRRAHKRKRRQAPKEVNRPQDNSYDTATSETQAEERTKSQRVVPVPSE
eukprot:gb/GECG01013147.1/.p1 GENE.gb/GECG01013147.1/~~gb/GECG01013147.1/.p1  ORF type:complete len:1097 (+),score=177.77 gb/GECG01013147.1/:1-3291(+)